MMESPYLTSNLQNPTQNYKIRTLKHPALHTPLIPTIRQQTIQCLPHVDIPSLGSCSIFMTAPMTSRHLRTSAGVRPAVIESLELPMILKSRPRFHVYTMAQNAGRVARKHRHPGPVLVHVPLEVTTSLGLFPAFLYQHV